MIRNLAANVEAFSSNVFLVEGDRPALVDAGADFDAVSAIRDHVDDLAVLVITHTHPDHVGNVDDIRDAFEVASWGFDSSNPAVNNTLEDGDVLQLGHHEYEALHTPGHAPDHLCLYAADGGILFSGDLIFSNGGFGRVDLAGSDADDLVASIDRVTERVGSSLNELHAGHGPSVTSDALHHVEMAKRATRTV